MQQTWPLPWIGRALTSIGLMILRSKTPSNAVLFLTAMGAQGVSVQISCYGIPITKS
jgi:hypothetical protein